MTTRAEFALKLKARGATAEQIKKGFDLYRQSNGAFDDEADSSADSSAPDAAKPGLLSPESLAPNTMDALRNDKQYPAQDSLDAKNWLQKNAANLGNAPGEPSQAQVGAVLSGKSGIGAAATVGSDAFGSGFRLLGALVPATRGKTVDAATGQERPRTFTEAVQNPQGTLTTPLDEGLNKTNLPDALKAAGHVALGVTQGFGVGAAVGAGKQIVKSLLAKAVEPLTPAMSATAKYVQNVRMGTTASDISKGASAGNAMKHGLGNKTLKNALPAANEKIDAWSKIRDGIYKKNPDRVISVDDVFKNVEENINAKDFGVQEKNAALQEIKDEFQRFLKKKPGADLNTAGFSPRRPISQLSKEEVQAGVDKGEIKYKPGGKGIPFEYAKPEVFPENAAPKIGPHINIEEADQFKQWIQEAGANFGKGSPRESSVNEKVFKDVYKELTKKAEHYAGPEYAKINKNLSEVIPIRNVIERALKREELGSDVVTKGGVIKRTANLAASATGLNRFGATGLNSLSEGIQAAAAEPASTIGEKAASSAITGALRGALVGMRR